ncbi:MAG: iron-sulfur cluster assembly protein [Phocaeicola sp.]|nr:iron-sulfur cluster assembly protein [Phocaeicola sp.]MDD7448210.1 iron-sulfur cluster assembly protein [Prevotellaceae bacterium]MDY3914376.1 iron-sulfur cluster assembly protein [Phocaeicola sp.]MDY5938641.1 iron-sulfur cluster assembly protein [Phocaeicola sp.]
MNSEIKAKTEERIIELLKTVYDPEIPVNIYDLGLIYGIDIQDDGKLTLEMTLTAPNCPMADFIVEDVRIRLNTIEELTDVQIKLVFEPVWSREMMSEEAMLELGLL